MCLRLLSYNKIQLILLLIHDSLISIRLTKFFMTRIKEKYLIQKGMNFFYYIMVRHNIT